MLTDILIPLRHEKTHVIRSTQDKGIWKNILLPYMLEHIHRMLYFSILKQILYN